MPSDDSAASRSSSGDDRDQGRAVSETAPSIDAAPDGTNEDEVEPSGAKHVDGEDEVARPVAEKPDVDPGEAEAGSSDVPAARAPRGPVAFDDLLPRDAGLVR